MIFIHGLIPLLKSLKLCIFLMYKYWIFKINIMKFLSADTKRLFFRIIMIITFTCTFCRLYFLFRNSTTCQIKPHTKCKTHPNYDSSLWKKWDFSLSLSWWSIYTSNIILTSTIVGMWPEKGRVQYHHVIALYEW